MLCIGWFLLCDLCIVNGMLKVGDNLNGEGLFLMSDIEVCCMDCFEVDLVVLLDVVNCIFE